MIPSQMPFCIRYSLGTVYDDRKISGGWEKQEREKTKQKKKYYEIKKIKTKNDVLQVKIMLCILVSHQTIFGAEHLSTIGKGA